MRKVKNLPFILTAIHGTFSLGLLLLSSILPAGGFAGGIGYIAALGAFLINLPGCLTLHHFYAASVSDGPILKWGELVGMILITDFYLLILLYIITWGMARMIKGPTTGCTVCSAQAGQNELKPNVL